MDIKLDRYLSFLFGFQYVLISLQYVIQMFTPLGSSLRLIISLVFNAVLIFLMIIVFKRVLEKKFYFILSTYLIAIIFVALNYLLFPENRTYILEIQFDFLFLSLLSFIYIYTIKDYSYLLKSLYKAALIVSVVSVLIYLIKIFLLDDNTYSIYFSYLITFSIIINLDKVLYNKKSILRIALILMNAFIVLHVGSRGAILCILTYLLLSLFFRSRFSLISKFLLLTFTTVFFVFYKEILTYTNQMLSMIGVYSRTLTSLTRENIYLSGREDIYENTILAINNNFFGGIGLTGDRVINNGTYTHNIILEILATFGVLFGSILIILLLIVFIKGCIFNEDISGKTLSIIYLSYTLPMLMVSRTLWTQSEFWILLALCLSAINFKTRKVSL